MGSLVMPVDASPRLLLSTDRAVALDQFLTAMPRRRQRRARTQSDFPA